MAPRASREWAFSTTLRQHPDGVVYGGRLYAVGGWDGSSDPGRTVEVLAPNAVGGMAEYPELEPEAVSSRRGSTGTSPLGIAGIIGGSALLLAAGGWYARRRWRAG